MGALMNSLVFDWIVRLRVSGQNIRHFQMSEMPFPPLERLLALIPIDTVVASESPDYVVSHKERWTQIAHAEIAVCKMFGLKPADYEYILASFPIFARKQPEFSAYLQMRLADWKEEIRESLKQKAKPYPPAEPSMEFPKAAEPHGPVPREGGK
jgi:hypothetical protein